MKVICEQMHRGAPHANTTGEREREREPVPAAVALEPVINAVFVKHVQAR
jgi:hypothetical protein